MKDVRHQKRAFIIPEKSISFSNFISFSKKIPRITGNIFRSTTPYSFKTPVHQACPRDALTTPSALNSSFTFSFILSCHGQRDHSVTRAYSWTVQSNGDPTIRQLNTSESSEYVHQYPSRTTLKNRHVLVTSARSSNQPGETRGKLKERAYARNRQV